MSHISNFFRGVGFFFGSLKIIFNDGLWHFLFYPVMLRVLLILLIAFGIMNLTDVLEDTLNNFLQLKHIPENGHPFSWLKNLLHPSASWLAWIISKITGIMIIWFLSTLNKYIVLILISPILALASEATEEKITGKKFTFSFGQLMKDIFRGMVIAIRNMSIEYLLFFSGFLLLLIPAAGAILFGIYQLFLLFASWYFFGFSISDYSCERHRFSIRESIRFNWKNRGLITGIGFCYWIFISVPFLGDWIGFSFAPIMGAVGSTMAFLELNKTN